MRVEDLDFEAAVDVILEIADAQENAGVAFRLELEFKVEDEVAVLLFGGDVVVEALSVGFAGPWFQGEHVVLLNHPIAGGLPAGEVLAIEHFDKTVVRGMDWGKHDGGGQREEAGYGFHDSFSDTNARSDSCRTPEFSATGIAGKTCPADRP